jgi:beta-galactosidase
MRFHLSFTVILILLQALNVRAQRQSVTINSNWQFHKGDLTSPSATGINWETVSIPHSWNKFDVMDDAPGYYRGAGFYKKNIYVPASWRNKDVYLHFEGAAQVTQVWVNGQIAGKHIGSYNAFNFPISSLLTFSAEGNSANEIVVKVDNTHNEDIPPLSADFTFFGGLYRDVYLQVAEPVHFDMDNHASNGIFITTPQVSAAQAELNIKGAFINRSKQTRTLKVSHQIMDANGKTVKSISQSFTAKAGTKVPFNQDIKNITNPKLWSVDQPYLYRLVSTITDAKSRKLVDQVSNPLGFRWFSFDPDKGFFLNGKPIKLIGASRHQDFKDMAHALPDAMHVRDVELLKEMGGNFLRIAHYPQDPAVIQACDRLGILTSVETPIVNQITETEAFAENSKAMHLEMIRQYYNHPSLIIWAYMNEVLLRPRYDKEPEKQKVYFDKITQLAQDLEDITRKEDRYRYTLIPNHGNLELYNRVKLTKIPKLVGWNLYQGWYSGNLDGFAGFLDKHHRELPDKPLLVTEYGADADNRLHSFDPIRFDKTVEYTNLYHKAYLKAMKERPFVAVGMIWNLAEFNSETRAEAMPHINNKGILTLDRKPKDGYRFYQANLLHQPFLQIGAREWTLRSGFAVSETNLTCTQPLQVFSNAKSVTLSINGKVIATSDTEQGVAQFNVPFANGINRLVAVGTKDGISISDQIDIQFNLLSQNLKSTVLPFKEISVSLGDKRFFNDDLAHQIWLPEQAYQPGSWGYVGGKVFAVEKSGRQSYGSDKNILGTELDPMYETQRVGIEQFKFDVPAGDYELILHFAELLSEQKKEELIYNLGNNSAPDAFREREFSLSINNVTAIEKLSNKEELKPEHAVSLKFPVSVVSNEGITVNLKAIKSEPILNGIQLRKIR